MPALSESANDKLNSGDLLERPQAANAAWGLFYCALHMALREFFDGMRQAFRALRETSPEQPQRYYAPLYSKTKAGAIVTVDTALCYSAVYAAMRAISQSLMQMGWHVLQVDADGKNTRLPLHSVDRLLDKMANSEIPAPYFRESLVNYALLWGNGYAEIDRDLSGRAGALWHIEADRVNPDRTQSGELVYDVRNDRQSNTVIPASGMFHLRGPSLDGICGMSIIGLARQSIGIGLAAEKFQGEFFSEGLQASGVVEHPGSLSPTARENIAKDMKEQAQGRGNWLVFEEGMKAHQLTIPPGDAQFLESRKFTVAEIARWFGVPLHMLEELDRGTFNNNEQRALEFASTTLVPWATRLEAEANAKLFGANRQNLITRLNVAALLRGDLKSRYDAYAVGRQWMFLSANDIKRHEGESPLPPHIGDIYLQPSNMVAVPLDPNAQTFSPQGQPVSPTPDPAAPPPAQQPGRMQQALADILSEPLGRIIRREQARLAELPIKDRKDPGYDEQLNTHFKDQRTYAYLALRGPIHAALTIFGGGAPSDTIKQSADKLLAAQIDGWCHERQVALTSGIDPARLPQDLATLSATLIERLSDLTFQQWAVIAATQRNGTAHPPGDQDHAAS